MSGLKRIPVEPLSEQRWAKIERAIFARVEVAPAIGSRPARRLSAGRPWLWAAVAAGALSLAALFVALGRPEPAVVAQPSRITTGASASQLALPGVMLDVAPQSAVVVGAETPQGLLVVVDRGTIVCDVAPRPKEAPVVVQAGAARVRVVGTRFSVTRLDEAARVRVEHGTVEVSYAGEVSRVHAGQGWPSMPAEAARAGATGAVSGALPAGDVPSVEAAARSAPERSKRPPLQRGPAPEQSPKEPALSPQAVFEEATALERSDPERASQLYATLESGGGSWSQNALFARGRLEASRGRRVEARRILERYLERYPRGSNAEDARTVLKQLK